MSEEPREFIDGSLVPGTRYRVVRLLGAGGMGQVYEVEHTELGKRFVLKSLLRELATREDLVTRLRNEWRSLAKLDHPAIVNVTDASTTTSGVPFYVMERLEGETLGARIRRDKRLPLAEAVRIGATLLDALGAAHEIGIVHRDVKPPNVFLAASGLVKLLDFGIAKIADPTVTQVTARGLAIGTPRYMSPEQAKGMPVDGRADIYALGLILYEMVSGAGPFDDAEDAAAIFRAHVGREPKPLASVQRGVPASLDRLVTAMLAKDPAARPASARAAAAELRGTLSDVGARRRQAPADAATLAEVPAARSSAPDAADQTLAETPGARASSDPLLVTVGSPPAPALTPTAVQPPDSVEHTDASPAARLGVTGTLHDPHVPSSGPTVAPERTEHLEPASVVPAAPTRTAIRPLVDSGIGTPPPVDSSRPPEPLRSLCGRTATLVAALAALAGAGLLAWVVLPGRTPAADGSAAGADGKTAPQRAAAVAPAAPLLEPAAASEPPRAASTAPSSTPPLAQPSALAPERTGTPSRRASSAHPRRAEAPPGRVASPAEKPSTRTALPGSGL